MAITALELNRHLVLDLGDGTTFSIPPIPGKTGVRMLGLLVGVAFGVDIDNAADSTSELVAAALGEGLPGYDERIEQFEALRASEQAKISQAAILWNVQGGSIEAVLDLLDAEEGTGYPKALGRVMRSCGLGQQYELLRISLYGASESQTAAESTRDMTIPSGISNTNE